MKVQNIKYDNMEHPTFMHIIVTGIDNAGCEKSVGIIIDKNTSLPPQEAEKIFFEYISDGTHAR